MGSESTDRFQPNLSSRALLLSIVHRLMGTAVHQVVRRGESARRDDDDQAMTRVLIARQKLSISVCDASLLLELVCSINHGAYAFS